MFNYREMGEKIVNHLKNGGAVAVRTHLRTTIYHPKHADWFSFSDKGIYVRSGKSKVCVSFCTFCFSV